MKIEFGVQEYFNELKLMDVQYGQEEELYHGFICCYRWQSVEKKRYSRNGMREYLYEMCIKRKKRKEIRD